VRKQKTDARDAAHVLQLLESIRIKHGSADTNQLPLSPKPGMSGALGR
jgi:hypothetical protein